MKNSKRKTQFLEVVSGSIISRTDLGSKHWRSFVAVLITYDVWHHGKIQTKNKKIASPPFHKWRQKLSKWFRNETEQTWTFPSDESYSFIVKHPQSLEDDAMGMWLFSNMRVWSDINWNACTLLYLLLELPSQNTISKHYRYNGTYSSTSLPKRSWGKVDHVWDAPGLQCVIKRYPCGIKILKVCWLLEKN